MSIWKRNKKRSKIRKALNILLCLIFILLILPQSFELPVKGMQKIDYNQESFWYYPWGKSGTHKGVDIFGRTGTPVTASVRGFVVATGDGKVSGKYVVVLGPKLRFHYFAHLNSINTKTNAFVTIGDQIGTLGATGNAIGKPPHLHYSIISWVPHIWRADFSPQGWRKMFYLNPIEFLNECYE